MTGLRRGLGYLLRRLVLAAITFLGVTLLVFLLTLLMPGDPVDQRLAEQGEAASSGTPATLTPEQLDARRAEIERELGLDRPVWRRYLAWLGDLCRFDLGRSLVDRKLVSTKIAERLPYTLFLNLAALVLVFAVSLPLGVLLALRRGSALDRSTGLVLDALYAAPYFWTAILLQYLLAVRLGWLPFGGAEQIGLPDRGAIGLLLDRTTHLILPACLLAYGSLAYFVRFVRAAVIDSLAKPFVVTARSLGLPRRRALRKFVLRHAWIALIPLAGALLGRLLAGSVLLEAIFSWPGIGQLFAEAVNGRDYPVVGALAALSAAMVLAAGLLADLALALADPRVSFERGDR